MLLASCSWRESLRRRRSHSTANSSEMGERHVLLVHTNTTFMAALGLLVLGSCLVPPIGSLPVLCVTLTSLEAQRADSAVTLSSAAERRSADGRRGISDLCRSDRLTSRALGLELASKSGAAAVGSSALVADGGSEVEAPPAMGPSSCECLKYRIHEGMVCGRLLELRFQLPNDGVMRGDRRWEAPARCLLTSGTIAMLPTTGDDDSRLRKPRS